MEDLFQIVLIAVFIISTIVSSINKKKKQQAKASKADQSNLPKKNVPIATQQKPANKMLEELLGFKIDIPEPPKREAPVNYSENETTWDPTKEYETKVNDGLNDYQTKNAAKKDQISHDRIKYKAFKDEPAKTKYVPKIISRKKIISSESNLKDYIVIQELLNKPKALRR